MWVVNATKVQMTNDEIDEFYQKVVQLVQKNSDPDQIESNFTESIQNLILCNKLSIKLIDVFKYKHVIDYSYLEQIRDLEVNNPANKDIWELISTTFELIRKSLKWQEIAESRKDFIIEQLDQYFMLINQKIHDNKLTLVVAEALGELINVTDIILNTYPNWYKEYDEKFNFMMTISNIYNELNSVFIKLSEMKFDEIKPIVKPAYEESLVRDQAIIVKPTKPDSNRITHMLGKFNRSTLSPEKKVHNNETFWYNNKSFKPNMIDDEEDTLSKSQFTNQPARGRKNTVNKIIFARNNDVDYEAQSLIDLVVNEDDLFSVHILLQSYKFFHVMIENLSSNTNLHLAMFQSGLVWKLFIYLMKEYSEWQLNIILETNRYQNKEEVKDSIDLEPSSTTNKLDEYYKMSESLLSNRLIEKLQSKVSINDHGKITFLDEFDMCSIFTEIYRSNNHYSPDLVWSENTRSELKEILEKEIEHINNGSFDWDTNPYESYEYSDQNRELYVEYSYKNEQTSKTHLERIYIKYFNKDVFYTSKAPYEFLNALVEKLDEIKNKSKGDSFELVLAIRG